MTSVAPSRLELPLAAGPGRPSVAPGRPELLPAEGVRP